MLATNMSFVIFAVFFALPTLIDAGELQRTFAMIKPDCVAANHTARIKSIIYKSGFAIVEEKEIYLAKAEASKFYAEHSQRDFFMDLVDFMISGPVFAMVLEMPNAVTEWRALIGPTDSRKARYEQQASIRAKFGLDNQRNCVHGSDSHQAAIREISFFFGGKEIDELIRHEEL